MNWLGKLWDRVGGRKLTSLSALINQWSGGRLGLGAGYTSYVNEGYKKNPIVFSATRIIGRAASQVPWIVNRQLTNGDLEEVTSGHVLNRLVTFPNSKQSMSKLIEDTLTYLCVSGHGYLLRLVGGGEPRFIQTLRPDIVSYQKENDPDSGWKVEQSKGPPALFPPEDILQLKFLDPATDLKGLSPIEVASLTIDQANHSRTWNNNLLRRDSRPSGILRSKVWVDKADSDKIIQSFVDKYGGASGAGLPPFLKGDIEWQPTMMSPADMDWLQGQRLADRLTGLVFGVPSQIMGDKDAAIYANYAEARKSLYEETIIPLLSWIADELNRWTVIPFFPEMRVAINTDDITALQEDKEKSWKRTGEADWISINEKRASVGYEELKGPAGELIVLRNGVVLEPGGQILVPSSLIPLKQALMEPEEQPTGGGPQPAETDVDEPEDDEAETDEPKFFNVRTRGQKISHWKMIDHDRERLVGSTTSMVSKQFSKQKLAVVRIFEEASVVENAYDQSSRWLDEHVKDWFSIYERIYSVVGSHFVGMTMDDLPKNAILADLFLKVEDEGSDGGRSPFSGLKPNKQGVIDIWTREVRRFIRAQSATKITGINQTTKKLIRSSIEKGIGEGESITRISQWIDKILGSGKGGISYRAERIARTEVIGASNQGSHFGAKATGLRLNKEWITTIDGRERDTHKTANGKKVEMDEAFTVGGSKLLFPGDTSLGAASKEIINCRCVVGYHPA